MAGRPWAVMVTAAVSALVAAGALIASAALRESDGNTAEPTSSTPTTVDVGVDGCLAENCKVLATVPVGDTKVELVAESGGTGGRLRIGGAGSSEVIEVTVTDLGAALTPESLRCVADSLSACLVGGPYPEGYAAQVVVGRSAQWNEIAEPFRSDAGFITLANVTGDPGPEILVAQHRCDGTVADCATTPVFLRVYNLRSQELGCTRNYARLDALPGWPTVAVRSTDLKPCA